MFNFLTTILWLLAVPKYNLMEAKPVQSIVDATEIGQRIAHKVFPDINYEQYELSAEEGVNEYIIAYVIPHICEQLSDGVTRITVVTGGGGPEIHINKSNGKITDFGLQK